VKRTRIRAGSDRGSELIELAVVLPILLLVFAAIADFGFLFQRYEVVTNAAREGARIAVLPGYAAQADTNVHDRVQNYLTTSGLSETTWTSSVTYQSETVGALTVQTARVTVVYPSRFMFIGAFAGFFGGGGWGTVNLRSVSTMRVEGGS